MKPIHFVHVPKGEGMKRIARDWAAGCGGTVSARPRFDVDANMWVGFQALADRIRAKKRLPKWNAALFTHKCVGKLGKHKAWEIAAERADLCVCMNEKYTEHLDPAKTVQVHPGWPRIFECPEPVRFLVSTSHTTERKGLASLSELRAIPGSLWTVTGGEYAFEELPALYDATDYLAVLSTLEGGPMPVLEALARHKPVIAPDVGYCWEWPVIRYTDLEDLIGIVTRLCRAADYNAEGTRGQAAVLKQHIEERLGE